MLGGKMFKRTEYLIARTSIDADALKRERVEICTTTTLCEGLGFRARKQLGAQALSSQSWSDPESYDVEPPPVDFAIDSTNKRATCISRNDAEALDLPIAGTLNI